MCCVNALPSHALLKASWYPVWLRESLGVVLLSSYRHGRNASAVRRGVPGPAGSLASSSRLSCQAVRSSLSASPSVLAGVWITVADRGPGLALRGCARVLDA